jgi:hypothetical protein
MKNFLDGKKVSVEIEVVHSRIILPILKESFTIDLILYV